MATATHLMTVEEFSNLPEDQGPEYSELHGGEIVKGPPPKSKHCKIQRILISLLEDATNSNYVSAMEFAFQPVSEYELRIADVVLVSETRYDEIDPEGYLRGSPELVIEVLSPSNTARDLYDREKLCLDNGGIEFWVIDLDRRQVKVSTPDFRSRTYKAGQQISLESFGGTAIRVDDVFCYLPTSL